jgi:hypothetical protein
MSISRGPSARVVNSKEWANKDSTPCFGPGVSLRSAFEDATHAWEQTIGKTLGDVVEVQTEYAKTAYDKHMAQVSRLGQMYVRVLETAFKPIEETTKRAA